MHGLKMPSILEQIENADKYSVFSELNNELNEWAALEKFSVFQGFKDFKNKQKKKMETTTTMKQELDK